MQIEKVSVGTTMRPGNVAMVTNVDGARGGGGGGGAGVGVVVGSIDGPLGDVFFNDFSEIIDERKWLWTERRTDGHTILYR